MRKQNTDWTRRERDLLNRLEAAREEAGKFKERQRRNSYDRRRAEKKLSVTVSTPAG